MTLRSSVGRGTGRARILVAVALTLVLAVPVGAELAPAGPAPDFALKSIDGPNFRLSEYRGEVVMLAFWASWCGDCRSEVEQVAELQRRYESVGFRLFAVSLDSQMRQAADTARSLNLEFPVLHDAGGLVGEMYDVDDLPLVVLIDREGNLRNVLGGKKPLQRNEYTSVLRDLLRE